MLYAVGKELPFPGWFWEGLKNEYNDSTLLMSLTDSKNVHFFSDINQALVFAQKEILELHSSPRTGLPLGMRAIFAVSVSEMCIKKINKVCLPFEPDKWKELNFDTSKSIYENEYTFESFIYTYLYSDRINLIASIENTESII